MKPKYSKVLTNPENSQLFLVFFCLASNRIEKKYLGDKKLKQLRNKNRLKNNEFWNIWNETELK